ncbi:putative secondary metabolism biosynthetic enzyme [Microsporum audouinii]
MLSTRGKKLTGILDEPWRALLDGKTEYDAQSNPSGLLSLSTAENPLMHEELTAYVNSKLQFDKSVWSYGSSAGGGKKFPAAMAGHINRYFDPYMPVKSSEILATNSIPSLNELLAFTLADEGDGILTSRPIYGRFKFDWGTRPGLESIYANTEVLEGFTPAAVEKYEEALLAAKAKGINIRVLIIVNPHNPLGEFDSEAIKSLCTKWKECKADEE